MGMTLVPAVPVDGEAIVSLDELKLFCRAGEDGSEDALLRQLRAAAIDGVERYTSKSLQRRGWRWSFSAFAPVLRLPREPVGDDADVTAISYRDGAGAEQVIATGGWIVSAGSVIAAPGQRWPATWCSDGAVTVAFEAGYEDVAAEAPGLVTAVMFLTKHFYERGCDDMDAVPPSVAGLCRAYRTPVIG